MVSTQPTTQKTNFDICAKKSQKVSSKTFHIKTCFVSMLIRNNTLLILNFCWFLCNVLYKVIYAMNICLPDSLQLLLSFRVTISHVVLVVLADSFPKLVCTNNNKLLLRWSVVAPLYKCSYEIGWSFADPLTVHSLYPSITSSCIKDIVFVFLFQSEIILWIYSVKPEYFCRKPFLNS